MKIRFTLPWGGEFYYEREPMDGDRFGTICLIVGVSVFLFFLYSLLTSATR